MIQNNRFNQIFFLLFTVVFIIVIANVVFAVTLSEVLFNPEGLDNNKEFIEIITTENLSNYTIEDADSRDVLIPLQQKNSTMAIIVEEGFNYSNLNCSVYSVGTTIGNNLNNDVDEIRLYDYNGSLLLNSSYYCDEHCSPGTSIQYGYNDSKHWFDKPSPCNKNKQSIFLQEDNTSEVNNTLFQNETETNISVCDYQLFIDSLYYFNNTKLEYSFFILPHKPDDFEITYWITEFQGGMVKEKSVTKNTNTKQYTPKSETYISSFIISAELSVLDCNETVLENNYDERVVFYIDDEKFSSNSDVCEHEQEQCEQNEIENDLSIVHVYEEKSITFGKPFAYKIHLENKNKLSVIDAEVITMNNETLVESEFKFFRNSDAIFSQELLLPELCEQSIDAKLIVHGIGLKDSYPIHITCNNPSMEYSKTEEQLPDEFAEQIVTSPDGNSQKESGTKSYPNSLKTQIPIPSQEITGNVIHQSKDTISNDFEDDSVKQKKLLPVFGFIIFLLIIILFARLNVAKFNMK